MENKPRMITCFVFVLGIFLGQESWAGEIRTLHTFSTVSQMVGSPIEISLTHVSFEQGRVSGSLRSSWTTDYENNKCDDYEKLNPALCGKTLKLSNVWLDLRFFIRDYVEHLDNNDDVLVSASEMDLRLFATNMKPFAGGYKGVGTISGPQKFFEWGRFYVSERRIFQKDVNVMVTASGSVAIQMIHPPMSLRPTLKEFFIFSK